MTAKIEFGDFQTPLSLANKCTNLLSSIFTPKCVIEPTCGLGSFLEASHNTWNKALLYGYEINKQYIDEFNERCHSFSPKAEIVHADFFSLDLKKVCNICENPLVIGNPPWVTNAQLGLLNSDNLPQKSNIKGLSGFDALSGKSNFDISEWMILKICEELKLTKGILAMLCKTNVARNVFLHNHNSGFKNVNYKIFKIDSKKEFNVSVDACFFIIDFYHGGDESRCDIYNDLDFDSFINTIGISDNKIIANIDSYINTKTLVSGTSQIIWRSGIKHDISKVMELKKVNDYLINGFDEKVDVEDNYLFPLLKSSDLANNRLIPNKFVIVTQKKVGEDTSSLMKDAPKLWKYLYSYCEELDGRKSSIYRNQPRFAIFGVGEYSFKPYKIAISGLYKKINFCLLSPFNNKTIMVDDTCYSLGFDDIDEAKKYLNILNSELVIKYISSLIFWDAKRPINSDILKSIDFVKAEKYYKNMFFNKDYNTEKYSITNN